MSSSGDKTLEFQCPKCAKRLKATSQAAGKRLKCPNCGQPVKVPGALPTAASDDDWLKLDDPTPAPAVIAPPSSPVAKSQPRGSASPNPVPPNPVPPKTDPTNPSSANPDSAKPKPVMTDSGKLDMTDLDALKLEPVNSAASTGSKAAAVPSPSKPSIFDDDLPELAELEAPRPRTSMAGILGIEGLDEVELVKPKPSAAGSSASGQSSSKAVTPTKSGDGKERKAETKQDLKKAAALDPANAQYRVPCPSCGTPQYVTLAKQGKQVKCPDCFSDFKIPPPPPGWKPTQPAQAKWGTDLVEPTAVEAQRDADRSKNQADDLLRQARQELDDNDIESMYDNDFDTQSFVRRTFGFAYDGVALFQIFIYALMFGFMFFIAQYCVNKVLIDDDKGYALIGGLSVPLLAIISAFPLFAGAMTLLESVANGQFKVREWPGFNFFDHVGELLLFGTALIASALPGFLLGGFVANSGGAGLIVVFTTMLTTFLAFPIVLLSMLDNESLFNPYSPEVLKSLSVGYEAWGTYYFKTFIANFVIFIAWAVMLGHNAILAGIGGMLLPLLIFFTVQQLGVLAFDISEHLSIIVPPKAEEEVQEA